MNHQFEHVSGSERTSIVTGNQVTIEECANCGLQLLVQDGGRMAGAGLTLEKFPDCETHIAFKVMES